MCARIFLVCLLLLTAGCASVFTVKSDPITADVFFMNQKNEKVALGKTPLDMPTSTLKQTIGEGLASGQFFTLIVEKKGFVSEKLLVPVARFGTLATVLDVKLKAGDDPKEEKLAQDVLNHMFLAQKMARLKQYERAQIELDKILTDVPEFPRALSMRASVYFMQKNYAESVKWYEAALKADPQMEDAVQMLAKVKEIQGTGRVPASTASAPATGKP